MRPQEVVVVREGNSNKVVVDPELQKLQSIPTFLPIMRGALTAPSARDPEVLERLDTLAFFGLCRRYQVHLNAAATLTSSHQDKLTSKIKTPFNKSDLGERAVHSWLVSLQLDSQVNGMVATVTDRQRAYARHAERLSQVSEVSHLLSRCHTSLNLILESLDTLNNFLPVDNRLEPFVWTTG
ncbi:UNVERIFIED_CONTAM: hypothetical protein GTU68_009924 [Idotea baltica]|nr:hypothetical protein [Idotea baltica]